MLIFCGSAATCAIANTHPFGTARLDRLRWDDWDPSEEPMLTIRLPSQMWRPDVDDPLEPISLRPAASGHRRPDAPDDSGHSTLAS